MSQRNVVARGWRSGMVGLLVGLSLFVPAGPVAAQQNPLPDREASVVIGAPDWETDSTGNGLDEVYSSYDAAIDPVTKKVFVADYTNMRVLRFPSYRTLQNGDPAEHVFGGDCPSPEVQTDTCFMPWTIEFDAAGRLWIVDALPPSSGTDDRLAWIDDAATTSDNTVSGALGWDPAAYGTAPNLWDIETFDKNGTKLILHDLANRQYLYWDISGNPTNGQYPYAAQPASMLYQPSGGHYSNLAYDYQTGGLWIQDYYYACVRYYEDPEDLSAPQGVIGALTGDCLTNEGGLSADLTSVLSGLWASADGTLFNGDYDNYRLLAYRDAAARAITALADGTYVSADEVYGAPDFTTSGYDDPAVGPEYIGYLGQISGDETNNTLVIPMEYPSSARLFITPESTAEEEETEAVQTCELIPDMAITPEAIELAAGGETTVTVTMRNLCNDAPFNNSDLLISLSDGLTVSNGSAGMVNLGQRAAWQGLSLAPAETRSWQATVRAADVLVTDPLHVVELYHLGGVAKRIDGIFVGATVTSPVAEDAPAPAPVAEAAAAAPALPTVLPNTAGEATGNGLIIAALMIAASGGAALLFRRR